MTLSCLTRCDATDLDVRQMLGLRGREAIHWKQWGKHSIYKQANNKTKGVNPDKGRWHQGRMRGGWHSTWMDGVA